MRHALSELEFLFFLDTLSCFVSQVTLPIDPSNRTRWSISMAKNFNRKSLWMLQLQIFEIYTLSHIFIWRDAPDKLVVWENQRLVSFGGGRGQKPSTFSYQSFPWSHQIDQKLKWKMFKSHINNMAWELWWSKYFTSKICFEICHSTGKSIGDQGID